MKLVFIRHAKVNLPIPRRCTAAEFDHVRAAYDTAPIVPVAVPDSTTSTQQVHFYASELPRTHATLPGLFGDVPFTVIPLLNEVDNRSFASLSLRLPYPVWQFMGRLEWLLNHSRQPEPRKKTILRCRALIRFLEEKNEDAILVSHEFFLAALLQEMKRQGYHITRPHRFRIHNLDHIEITR